MFPTYDFWRKYFFFKHSFILHRLERGTKPILTPHDSRRHFGLSGIQTCVHPHGSPALYHCATGADFQSYLIVSLYQWFSQQRKHHRTLHEFISLNIAPVKTMEQKIHVNLSYMQYSLYIIVRLLGAKVKTLHKMQRGVKRTEKQKATKKQCPNDHCITL